MPSQHVLEPSLTFCAGCQPSLSCLARWWQGLSHLLASPLAFARSGMCSRRQLLQPNPLPVQEYIPRLRVLGMEPEALRGFGLFLNFFCSSYYMWVFFASHSQPSLLSLGDKLMKAALKRGRGDGCVQERGKKKKRRRRSGKE